MRKKSPPNTDGRAGEPGSPELGGDPGSCWASLTRVENPAGAWNPALFIYLLIFKPESTAQVLRVAVLEFVALVEESAERAWVFWFGGRPGLKFIPVL